VYPYKNKAVAAMVTFDNLMRDANYGTTDVLVIEDNFVWHQKIPSSSC
jgi:hypothetical protein